MISLLAGLLTAIAFPTSLGGVRLPEMGWLAWGSLVPLYLSLARSTVRQGLRHGFLFGCGLHGLSLYWITIALHRYGEIPIVGAVLGLVIAVALLSVLFALACGLAVFLTRRGMSLYVVLPLVWTLHDWIRNYFPFGGFPWGSLATTQGRYLTLIQSLDLFGVYGLGLLILLVNGLLARSWGPSRRFSGLHKVLVTALFLANILYGIYRIHQVDEQGAHGDTRHLALIQGNIPQDEKWLEELSDEVLGRHLHYSYEAEQGHPDLVIWPEAAYPSMIPLRKKVSLEEMELDRLKTPLLTGVVTYQGVPPDFWMPRPPDPSFAIYNSAMVVEPGVGMTSVYHKHHLVPFGEYVPFEKGLSFLDKIVPAATSFSRGTDYHPVSVASLASVDRPFRMGVTICYEDIFPEIARRFTLGGADFLVNLTNDAWYDRASMVYQHLDYSRFRAVENRRHLVRVTNTGITAHIDPVGRVQEALPPFTEGVLQVTVGMGGVSSCYTRWGDWLPVACLAMLVMLATRQVKKSHKKFKKIRNI